MIFYTLQGPVYKLEIYSDRLRLVKKGLFGFVSRKDREINFPIQTLSQFEIAVPQFIWTGKLRWKSFNGVEETFRFSTNAAMVKKIETYLQKRIEKNHKLVLVPEAKKEEPVQVAPVSHVKTFAPRKKRSKRVQRVA